MCACHYGQNFVTIQNFITSRAAHILRKQSTKLSFGSVMLLVEFSSFSAMGVLGFRHFICTFCFFSVDLQLKFQRFKVVLTNLIEDYYLLPSDDLIFPDFYCMVLAVLK